MLVPGGREGNNYYRVQNDVPAQLDIKVEYADILNPPHASPPTVWDARKVAGVSNDQTCTVAEMTVSTSARLITIPTWTGNSGDHYICLGVETTRVNNWLSIEDRHGSGNVFEDYQPNATATLMVGNISYTIRVRKDSAPDAYSGRNFILE